MPARTNTRRNRGHESAHALRERRSAQQVAEWEAAFRAATSTGGASATTGDDSANAGAIVSRAHRAEKKSGERGVSHNPGD